MRGWLGFFGVTLASAAAAHAVTLNFAPAVIMNRAMTALEHRGVALHAFTAPQRINPQTQTVVRSSPDLYYALCRYDLGDPDMRLDLIMENWPDYQSLSFFDAQTDNFVTMRGTGERISVRLLPPGSSAQDGAIVSPTTKGVILIRRLAPDSARFDAAAEAGRGDACRLERISR